MKMSGAALILVSAVAVVAAGEPDGLTLPPGFHATVVAEGLGPIRHLAVRANGDIYVSTPSQHGRRQGGIIAIHLDANHRADQVQHFGTVDGGTGIRFYNEALYASSPSGVYRFTFDGDALVPAKAPKLIVDGMPTTHPGFNRVNRPIAFDGKGNLFVALDASANLCTAQTQPPPGQPLPTTPPVGLKPCPDLGPVPACGGSTPTRSARNSRPTASSWPPASATSTRSTGRRRTGSLYGIMHGRDNTHRFWPDLVSADDDDHIADEMHRITKVTDFGWPYTYYDGERKIRLIVARVRRRREEAAPRRHIFHAGAHVPFTPIGAASICCSTRGARFPRPIATARSSSSTARETRAATTWFSCRLIGTERRARRPCSPTDSPRSIAAATTRGPAVIDRLASPRPRRSALHRRFAEGPDLADRVPRTTRARPPLDRTDRLQVFRILHQTPG